MHIAMGILLVSGALGDLEPQYVALFEKHSEVVRSGEHAEYINYRLFVPEIDAGTQYPLIVWLHGYGERGTDNFNQLKWLEQTIFRPPRERDRFPFFLLAVQCPEEMGAWRRRGKERGNGLPDMLDYTDALVEKLLDEYPIDADRVLLSGLSSGGIASWQYARRYPDRFAALAPLASYGVERSDLSSMFHLPIWAFHSTRDTSVSVDGVRHTVYSIQGVGGNAYLTEVDSADHNCWSAAFQEYGLLDWLLAQRRGHRSWLAPPGTTPLRFRIRRFAFGWTWWQALVQVVVVVALGSTIIRLAVGLRRLFQHGRNTRTPKPPRKGTKKRLGQMAARAHG